MQPPIQSPTLNAILQIVYALGIVASVLTPLAKSSPGVYAFLQRLTAWGLDFSKAFGASRVATEDGPAPKTSAKPATPTKLPPLSVIMFAFALFTFALMIACNAAQQTVFKDTSGVVCEVVVQAKDPKLAPLCSTLTEVEQIIFDLKGAHIGGGNYAPSQDEVYQALLKKRGAGK